jgi:hypothetical protein
MGAESSGGGGAPSAMGSGMDASAIGDMYTGAGDPTQGRGYGNDGGLVDPYLAQNLATDIGPSVRDLTPTDYKKVMGDLSKTLEGVSGKLKDGSAATLAKSGALPGGISMGGSKGSYRDEANPYDVPSYLQSSQEYSNQTAKMVNSLLKGYIRTRSIKSLI